MLKIQPILLTLIVVSIPFISEARSNDWDVNRDDLDDDIVEEFPMPVLFGLDYKDINPDFGDSRGDGTRFHEGEDMLAPLGTPVVSPTEAIVIRTGDGASSGLYVYTAAPGGETFRYMHLDTIARNLERGDELDPGDLIGTVGDTGNAASGQYHLHFEVRDEDNVPTDPYFRIDPDGWRLSKKMRFLEGIFRTIRNDEEYAKLLLENFDDELHTAYNEGYSLPDEIEDLLDDQGYIPAYDRLGDLELAFRKLPALIRSELGEGDIGPEVAVLQLYLMYMSSDTDARARLRAAGPTGYFGGITTAALEAYQNKNLVDSDGRFDAATKAKMLNNRDNLSL